MVLTLGNLANVSDQNRFQKKKKPQGFIRYKKGAIFLIKYVIALALVGLFSYVFRIESYLLYVSPLMIDSKLQEKKNTLCYKLSTNAYLF